MKRRIWIKNWNLSLKSWKTNKMKKLNFQKWYEEYKDDLKNLYIKLNHVLKSRDIEYKERSFGLFCKLIFSKSSKYG